MDTNRNIKIHKMNALETLDFAFHIDSTPTFLYFDLSLNTAYAAHYVYVSGYIVTVHCNFEQFLS